MAQYVGISSKPVKGIYVYCIAKSGRKPSVLRSPGGLPGATPPEVVDAGDRLWLVLADVPLETYGSDHLDARLQDLDWVGQIALAHEAVVEHFAGKSGVAVIPMKLFTMFSSRDRAVAEITRRRASLEATARRIAGAEEWGIRIMRSAAGAAAASSSGQTASDAVLSGAAFLAAKKQARDAARDARVAAAACALDAYERLAVLARETRRRDDTPASATTPPLLDAAFLVPAGKRARFKAAVRREAERCARAGAELNLSGPWPAYNFVESGPTER